MKLFSRTVAGMLVKTGDSQTVIPLVQNLVRLDQFQEATRVMDMMIQNGMDPEMDQIRLYLLHHFDACRDGGDLMNIIDRWDEAVAQREQKQKNWSSVPSDKSQPSLLSSIYLDQEQSGDDRAVEYFRLVDQCIRSHDIQGALSAAKYIAQQGWAAQGLDFQKLNSVMVNHSYSSYASSYFSSFSASDYLIYLQVRYTLGGSVAPDLHTYRRLVFAACRRSDLYTALTLFELVRTRHPTWKLDSTIYNAIISTAAAIGEIRIAEKTFKCLLKDEVQPDHYSFHGLLNGYGNSGNLKAAITVPKMMLKHKLQPTTRTFNLVMKAYLSEGRGKGDLATSRKLLRAMQLSVTDKGKKGEIAPDLASFNQILEGYRRVGNTLWFDAYFDQYFGSNEHSRQDDLSPTVVKPEEADDRTLFIQLKHSLKLADVDLTTVRELWQAIEHKLKPSQASSPPSSNDHADFTGSIDPISSDVGRPTENLSSTLLSLPALSPVSEPDLIDLMGIQDEDGDTLPSTHIPFPRWLDPVWMPMTDYDYFRFTTLRLFRSTFQAHGDVAGVKTVESILADLFPAHPISQAVLKRRMVKRIRHAAKLKERESSDSMGYLKSKTISIKNRGK
ncbi:hypothetical protein BCR41DRAFT_367534 [Lobosporangium transversale]|uniref:Pentatricopeptide repeat-containing protein-mitochondrial domain-containing protein n=1 Tax=Lobosporangium transversale TaxID=64571 RepID=A0A1Y2H0D2_9FUNG|nr:hypothetical protein BCR41DRAFT_367534 [Lobosporangium transversale]ORZ28009.1 hypothetical protein BCR41DRAFT_367534 [Lobosporangium transversale]|eukprot:XP_021885712.1 hypothetical protein BCR41DRAFT_367534 [Lobosporangium transversale]